MRFRLHLSLIEEDIRRLSFEDIQHKVEREMDGGDFKEFIVVEPYEGFVKEIEMEIFSIQQSSEDTFFKKDRYEMVVKKLTKEGVNVSKKDIECFKTRLNNIKVVLFPFLPYGAWEYSTSYGIKKLDIEHIEETLGFD